MNREPEFRERLREWASRPPRRPAHEVAGRARATAARHRAVAPLVWAAAALAVVLGSLALLRSAERIPGTAPAGTDAVPTVPNAAPAAARFVVVELRSGSRLYVDLATARRTS